MRVGFMSQDKVFSFKFKFVDFESKQAKGMLANRGYVDDKDLVLKDIHIPLVWIIDSYSREKRMGLAFSNLDKLDESIIKYINKGAVALEVSGVKADELEDTINRKSSVLFADLHRKKLEEEGKRDLFKAFICPKCNSTIDFSGYKTSEYIYCPYCNSVLNQSLKLISDRNTFSHCDECNLFNFVKKYTVFNFYFLLLIYGFQTHERYLCGNCASTIGKKTLLQNLIFILGVPSAIYMILRARKNNQKGENELRKANENVLNGDFRTADSYFNELRNLYHHHPGIVYNQARAHMIGKDYQNGVDFLIESLDYCSNYGPALIMVNKINQSAKS